ncbi:MAG: hypothetical protein VX044_08220 [Planctomycetota bacterium]|nr:hypothetical protein [Planctomycetota bacterium]
MTKTPRKLVPLAVALLALAAPTSAQKAGKIPADADIPIKLKKLKAVAKDKTFERDAQGINIIDVLIQKQQRGLNSKDQKSVVKGLDSLLNKGRLRPVSKVQIYNATAEALGRFGKDGAKVLKSAYEKKRFPDKPAWIPLREKLLVNIGRTKDEAMIKMLLDEARRSPEAALQAAAGKALGNYRESKQSLRRDIVSGMIIKWGSLSEMGSQLGANVEAQNAKDRLAAISGPWNDTMKALTGQDFDTFRSWQSWYNKNKNGKW